MDVNIGMHSGSRSTTPSRPASKQSSRNMERTPEEVKQIELNRLRAKARQREMEKARIESASSADVVNVNNKRLSTAAAIHMHASTASASSSASVLTTAGGAANWRAERPLKRDSRLGKYFEYDLSKMVNSKGGFLVVEDGDKNIENLRSKERERERERAMQNIEPPMYLDPSKNPKCRECGAVDLDNTFRNIFRCFVCNKCKNDMPEKYSLLTKTECKEDYLLTDAELRDEEVMPHLLKANPHKSTYSNMMLFLRCQVEEFAWKKWGSPEALDAEYERRVAEKKRKKSKKFEEGLKELRRRTRESVWQIRKDQEHQHVFGVVERGLDGEGVQVCHECGFTIDVEEF